jgi:hypothetical protein
MADVMEIMYYSRKRLYMDLIKKNFIYRETKTGNQLNDKHMIYNKIFVAILNEEIHLTSVPASTPINKQ